MSANGSQEEGQSSGWFRTMVQRTLVGTVKTEQVSVSSDSEQEAVEERDPALEVKQSPSTPEGEKCVLYRSY